MTHLLVWVRGHPWAVAGIGMLALHVIVLGTRGWMTSQGMLTVGNLVVLNAVFTSLGYGAT